MVAPAGKKLGSGLYTVAEAALYARVSTAMMTRWLFGTKSGQAVIEPEYGRNEKVVSFLDLIQTLAIREIRPQKQVPLPKFRQAIRLAKDLFQLDHPFARKHCTYLLGDELVIRPDPDQDDFVEASGKHKWQRLFSFVELYLEDLDFGTDGLAKKYRIFSHPSSQFTVTMDPHHRLGEPMLPSGYTAIGIWDAIQAEGGIQQAARAFDIPPEEVSTAYRFVVDFLGKAAA